MFWSNLDKAGSKQDLKQQHKKVIFKRRVQDTLMLAAGPLGVLLFTVCTQQAVENKEIYIPITITMNVNTQNVVLALSVISMAAIWIKLPEMPVEPKVEAAPIEPTNKELHVEEELTGPALQIVTLPEDLLRSLFEPQMQSVEEHQKELLTCPCCEKVMLRASKVPCGNGAHHACTSCLKSLHAEGQTVCPNCGGKADLADLKPPAEELTAALAKLPCKCTACGEFEGTFRRFQRHALTCMACHSTASFGNYRLSVEAEMRHQFRERASIEKIWQEMAGTLPALLHQVPADVLTEPDRQWATPYFGACGYLWSMRIGVLGGREGARYFCLLPHQTNTDRTAPRLKFSVFFAKPPGQGFKERLVVDWPEDMAGHPWGPTMEAEELQKYMQADGTLIFMVHAHGLGSDESLKKAAVPRS